MANTTNRYSILADQPEPSRPRPNLSPKWPVKQTQKRPNKQPHNETAMTRKYFKILQAVHHAEILADNFKRESLPKGLQNQVKKLSSGIKPSSPNENVNERIRLNTMQWMSNNMSILREHYDQVLATELETAGPFDHQSFDKAITWAKNRYRRKLTTSSIDTCKGLLYRQSPTDNEMVNSSDPDDFPPLPMAANPESLCPQNPVMRAQVNPTLRAIYNSPEADISPPAIPSNSPMRAPLPQRSHTVKASVHTARSPEPPPGPERSTITTPPVHNDDENGEKDYSLLQVNFNLSMENSGTESGEPAHLSDPPTTSNVAIIMADNISAIPSTVEQPTLSQRNSAYRPINNLAIPSETLPPPQMTHTSHDIDLNNQADEGVVQPSRRTAPVTARVATPPRADTQFTEPLVHRRTERKIADWQLKIRKPNIIIGDSNLARISPFSDPELQVDSFPGATCIHVTSLMKKLNLHPEVETVVLSVGLNNCLREQDPTTAWKQLSQMVSTATSIFPMATIHIPLINASNRLTKRQQLLIQKLNSKIQEKLTFLDKLENNRFEAELLDPVHWTKKTADAILKSWRRQLNL